MKTRIFVTICTLNHGTDKYLKEKVQMDFPDDVSLEAAYEEIWAKYGKLGRDDRWSDIKKMNVGPDRHAVITGHTKFDEHRKPVEIGNGEKMVEEALFTPQMLKESVSYDPSKKRRNR